MRVISGIYKGKKLEYDIDGTRPTMDRIKESLFGMIQSYIKGSNVLDLFAGSGSLGIEAISNGAQKVILIDKNEEAIKVIKKNTLEMSNIEIIKSEYANYLNNCKIQFDIIFLDPPYHEKLMEKAINLIIKNNLLTDKGIIVCEIEESFKCDLNLVKCKKYGDKEIRIYNFN